MRLAISAILLSALIIGLGFTHSDGIPTFITAPVERGSISSVVKATGTTEAVLTVDVSSQLSGRIAAVFVDFNDSVKAGEPIAQLDQEIFAARVNEARAALSVARAAASVQKAALERAEVSISNTQTAKKMAEAQSAALKARQDELERDLARKLALERTGSVAERDVSQLRAQRDAGAADLLAATVQVQMREEAIAIAQAEQRMAEANRENALAVVEQKQAALDQARLDLERTVLRAPIDGVIIKRDVNPGQTVAVSLEAKTLFKIANDLGEMEVHGKIDEADIGRIRVGQTARFMVDAYPDRNFVGRVQQIRKSPEIVQNVVTYTTIISAPNPDLLLLPGMTAQLQVTVNESGEIVKIPNQALRFRPASASSTGTTDAALAAPSSDGRATIWVVGAGGRAAPLLVKLGVSDDASTEVLEGAVVEGQPLIVGIANSQSQRGFLGIRLGF
jgi:HlyD family secretion protein